jgi:predicted DsbA family dithiol-disulfide isomerase
MNIEIWYDLVCPWCYLAKHRLEAVLLSFGGDVSMTFRAYQLDPRRSRHRCRSGRRWLPGSAVRRRPSRCSAT